MEVTGGDAFETAAEIAGNVAALLHGDGRDSREGLSVVVNGVGEVANDEDVTVAGNGEVGVDQDAATTVGFGAEGFGSRMAGRVVGPGLPDLACFSARSVGVRVFSVFLATGRVVGSDSLVPCCTR